MAGLIVVTGMAFEARIAAGAGVEVLCGAPGRIERALAARLLAPCDGVISFGVAGGLAPSLRPGSVLIAERVIDGAHSVDADPRWRASLRAALPAAVLGALVGADGAVAGVAEKRALWRATGGAAVDMESHRVARLAYAARVPYAACRVVIDPAGRAVPSAALAAIGPDGRTRFAALLGALLRRPGQLAGLLLLARDAGRARAVLRATRRQLGARFALPPALTVPPSA